MNLGQQLGIVGALATDVDHAVALGCKWIRASDAPEWFHQTESAFDAAVAAGGLWPQLAAFKASVDYAHSQGIKVLAHPMGAWPWARGTAAGGGVNEYHQAILPTKRAQFAEFCRQIALTGVDAVEIINEPNLANQYVFSPAHPRAAFPTERNDDYAILLRVVYNAIKSDPLTAKVLVGVGATASVAHEQLPSTAGINPTNWYTRLFAAKADDRVTPVTIAGAFDFVSHHPYAWAPAGPIDWTQRWVNQPGDAAYWHGIAMTWRIRQVLVANGQADKLIWATELGGPTGGNVGEDYVTEAVQSAQLADYMTAWFSTAATGQVAPLSTTYFGGWTGPLFVYQLKDRSDGVVPPTDEQGFFGMRRYNNSNKPSATLFQTRCASSARIYKTYVNQAAALADDVLIAQAYCASKGKPWPEPPDSYSPGRQPQPPAAFYQSHYALVRSAGTDSVPQPHFPVDETVAALPVDLSNLVALT